MSCPSSKTTHSVNDVPEILVNGTPISTEDIAREVQYHPAASPREGIHKAAEALVIRTLLLQKAREVLTESSEVLSEEALISALLEREAPAEFPSSEECHRYFESHRESFRSPDLLQVSHILIAAAPDDEAALQRARQTAVELLAQLQQSPEQFASLAKEFSACPSKETGGNLGQISRGQTTPEFEQQVFALAVGLAHEPIESRYGVHVVQVDRKIAGKPLPYEQVHDQVSAYLAEVRQRMAINRYLHQLIDEAEIEGIELGGALIQ
ncbi:MAG: peptidylprolyl isomerase [Porticoccaceae bacterium]